jgi:hypothetical protein
MSVRSRSSEEVIAQIRASDPLNEYFTRWDRIAVSDWDLLASTLDSAKREEDVQQFLQASPKYLIQHLGGGHGRWVIPKC